MGSSALRVIGILKLALQEALGRESLPRIPEPSAEMGDPGSVAAFHRAGEKHLTPVYLFNARAIDALAPRGAHVVDLGSGSSQFLAYLAERRPDLRITGIELADTMLDAGQNLLKSRGLTQRVHLIKGDMRSFRSALSQPVDLVSSIFALHHLPSREDLHLTLAEIADTRQAEGAALWIFDHARPKLAATAESFPEVFTADAFPAFKQDSRNSLKASWAYAELKDALAASLGAPPHSCLARLLPLYHIHWLAGKAGSAPQTALWHADKGADEQVIKDADGLAGLFKRFPGRE